MTERVICKTFDELLEENPPAGKTVDILLTDTEGFDAQILDMVDFERIAPKLLRYESKHWSQPDTARVERRLEAAGYFVEKGKEDSIAVRPELVSRLGYLRNSLSARD